VDIVWDTHKANSIKDSTREKRGKGQRRKVTGDTKIPPNWKAFLQDNTNKKELFALLTSRVSNFQFTENKEVNITSDESVVSSRGSTDILLMWDSLSQHALRAVYQSSIWYTSLQAVQMVPSPEGWGWCDMDGTWKPVWMTHPEAAKVCLELLKCGCKQECAGRCKCIKAYLSCTGLCHCSGECSNN